MGRLAGLTKGMSDSSTSALTRMWSRSVIVIKTDPGRLIVPAITISPTRTDSPVTTPSIGARISVRLTSSRLIVFMASLSRNSRRHIWRPASAL